MNMNSLRIGAFVMFWAAASALAGPIDKHDSDPPATCSGGAQVITIPESSTEAEFDLTCPGFRLPDSVDGTVAVFLDAPGVISDFVTFANVGNAADFAFVSDIDGGPALVPPAGVPILTTVTEPTPVAVVATSPNGKNELQFIFSSDTNETSSTSDTITIGPVPEPGSVALMGLGTILVLFSRFRRARRPASR